MERAVQIHSPSPSYNVSPLFESLLSAGQGTDALSAANSSSGNSHRFLSRCPCHSAGNNNQFTVKARWGWYHQDLPAHFSAIPVLRHSANKLQSTSCANTARQLWLQNLSQYSLTDLQAASLTLKEGRNKMLGILCLLLKIFQKITSEPVAK